MKLPNFYMFIDESGDASLNHKGQHFMLASVIINRQDFEIIQGYLRLLKRKWLGDDYKVIHATDLFERPQKKYRKLFTPKDTTNHFIHQLHDLLVTVPYSSCVYYVDKDKLRDKLKYKPVPGHKAEGINLDLPYEVTAMRAIMDFAQFVQSENSLGEIVIESRLHRDSNFVSYFDNMRKEFFPGGEPNLVFKDVKNSIPSLFICNKDSVNNGLEIADLVAYVSYRELVGDPRGKMKLSLENVHELNSAIKKSAHKGNPVKLVHELGA